MDSHTLVVVLVVVVYNVAIYLLKLSTHDMDIGIGTLYQPV